MSWLARPFPKLLPRNFTGILTATASDRNGVWPPSNSGSTGGAGVAGLDHQSGPSGSVYELPGRPAKGPKPGKKLSAKALWLFPLIIAAPLVLGACTPGSLIAWGRGWSPTAVGDGVVYVGTREGKVLALDAGNGSLIWEFDPGEGLELGSVFGTPAVGEQHIYVGGDSGDREGKDGRLYALRKDRQSGNDIRRTEGEWVRPPTEGEIGAIVGGPALAEGLVLVGSNDGNLYAYHATGRSSGEEAWRFSTDGQIWSTPVVADGIVYFGSMDRHVYAVYATGDRAGETAWKYRTGGAVLTKPLLFEGMVIAGSFDTKLYALDSRTGLPRWSFEGDDWFWAGAVSDGDHIFASSMAGTVYALDRDGIPLWPLPFKAGSPIISTPVVVGDALVVGTDEGKLHLLSTRNGKETAQVKVLGGPVKAALSRFENMVYVGDEDDMVRGVDAKGWVVQWRYP